ncbi:hypothetical protein WJX73_009433 [Symbiochloris irregularis]|uniref:Uncharacterized protein n=1 Tax=Symbiochloris irregularis TaxID=706552 RepID=A0AAW1NM83_9CHLO
MDARYFAGDACHQSQEPQLLDVPFGASISPMIECSGDLNALLESQLHLRDSAPCNERRSSMECSFPPLASYQASSSQSSSSDGSLCSLASVTEPTTKPAAAATQRVVWEALTKPAHSYGSTWDAPGDPLVYFGRVFFASHRSE